MARITETTFQESAPRVDAENGILFGVKLLGEVSKNGRRYMPKAMREAVPKYEGRKSYVDHPEREKLSEDRKFKDWSGVFRNVQYREGQGIFADQHLRRTSQYFDGILEAAEKFPNEVGYSHVADGASRMEGETEIIESITEVFSVDLVTDPATTAGFFESHRKKKTLRDAIESLPDGTARKRLIEQMDGGYMDGSMSMGADDVTDPQSQLFVAFGQVVDALVEVMRNLTMEKAQAPPPAAPAVADPAAAPAKAPAAPAAAADPTADPNAPKKPNPFESRIAELEAKDLLRESGREATPVRIKALAATAEADRAALLESWPLEESTERPFRSPPLIETVGSADFPRNDSKKFAQLLR